MVQSYGVATGNNDSYLNDANVDEARALLGSNSMVKKRDGHATLISSISNLLNTIIGSGMLTFPLAMASGGMIPGMITCIFSGGVAAFGLYLLSFCATKAKHRQSSFHAISQLTFPSVAVWFDAAIATKCFGVSISYLIIIKGLMPNVVESLYHDLASPDVNPPAWALSGRNWLLIFMLILAPLSFLKSINSLRHSSYIALFSVAYLITIVITCYFWPLDGMPTGGDVHLIHLTPGFVATFPVQVFAFTCAQNFFPIYNEVKDNSQETMNTIVGGSIGTAVLTYQVIAVFGYLTFGSKVGPNIIAMYPSTSLFIAAGQLAIVTLVLFSYPLQVHPCRNCLDKVFHPEHVIANPKSMANGDGEDDEEELESGGDEHGHYGELSTTKRFLLTTPIVVGGFAIAYIVDDLQLVISFVGSTGSTVISFVLPGLLYWKLTLNDRNVSRRMNLAAFALMVYGLCVCVFCLSYNVYKVVNHLR